MENKETILVAEDEVNDVFLMQRALRKMNASISLQVAKDGEEAIHYLAGEGKFANRTQYPLPRLIVLDIKMPRKTGFEVLEWIKASGQFDSTPVVMYSSSTMRSDIEKAHRLGAVAYMVKPMSFDDMKALFLNTNEFIATHSSTLRS